MLLCNDGVRIHLKMNLRIYFTCCVLPTNKTTPFDKKSSHKFIEEDVLIKESLKIIEEDKEQIREIDNKIKKIDDECVE